MLPRDKKVLVVDDEADLREALATAFSFEGFQILTAEDGEAGLKKALEEKPDIMLLDIMMPKMDGLEVLRNLRQDPWGKNVQVIVMTALDEIDKVAQVIEVGVDEYVMKSSITLGGIVEKVKKKLGVK